MIVNRHGEIVLAMDLTSITDRLSGPPEVLFFSLSIVFISSLVRIGGKSLFTYRVGGEGDGSVPVVP